MAADIGIYNKDACTYRKLVDELYESYKPITLPPEYAYFLQENSLRFLILLARYKFVAKMLKNTDEVLEIGSGSGIGSIFLGQHCLHVTGIDVKTTEIEQAKLLNRRSNVEFKQCDLFELEDSKKYDVIVALDVIEHMQFKQGKHLVEIMAKRLKMTGMVILGTPSIYSYEYQSALSKASHVKCYDQQELLKLIDDYFGRTIAFSMNDEMVHTGHPKMAWYYFVIAFLPKKVKDNGHE